MTAVFRNPIFQDEAKAREALEAARWPQGPICPHCGNSDGERIAKLEGKSGRPGLFYCNECRGQFTVTVGTVFERSKVPLTKWWMAVHMFNSGNNGVSAHEIHRNLGVTYKTAWFMMHRIREAMTDLNPAPMGGQGAPVQADETYYGNTSKRARKSVRNSGITRPCTTPLASTPTSRATRPTTSKTSSASSSAECGAPIAFAASSTFNAT